jgi:dTDP-4-dehydrorhamnose 3,5-epimerase
MQKLIEGIQVRKLEKKVDERGFLCELLRRDWGFVQEFAMAYFSLTYPGIVRAWHRHARTKQIDNMCVIQGMAKIAVYDDRKTSETRGLVNEFVIGEENMQLLRIPGVCWHGFKALGTRPVILLNFPDKLYNYENPDEERLPADTQKIPYDWKLAPWLKHG